MNWVAPSMLLGLLAVAIPIVVHFLGRRRARIVPFAALEFLLGGERRTRTAFQFRERILLAVRVIACVALALIFAQPFATYRTRGLQATTSGAAVFIVDDSLAASYQTSDGIWLEPARTRALSLLSRIGAMAEVAVVRSSQPSALAGLSRDHLRVRDALRAIRPSARVADWPVAMRAAFDMLALAPNGQRQLYIFTPRPPPNSERDIIMADGVRVHYVDCGPLTTTANRAVVTLGVDAAPELGPRGLAVIATIRNEGPAVELPIALDLDDHEVARGSLSVPAAGEAQKRFLATLDGALPIGIARVRLPDDAMRLDNQRWAVARVGGEVRTLLVNGDPKRSRVEDETYFVDAALAGGPYQVRAALLDELATLALTEFDVIVLANVPALPPATAAAIASWVEAGGGLFVATGHRVDADSYARTMTALVPPLRPPLDVGWGAVTNERKERSLALLKWDATHPVFAAFAPSDPSLSGGRTRKVTLIAADAEAADRVLARFDNDAPALLERQLGEGRILVLLTTLDRDWNDLPVQPGYLPLLRASIQYLARSHSPLRHPDVMVDATQQLPWQDATRLEIIGPSLTSVLERSRDSGPLARFDATAEPGPYRVFSYSRERGRAAADFAFVVNPDLRHNDVSLPVPAPTVATPVAASPAPASQRRIELWHAAAAILMLALLLEGLLTRR